MAVDASTQVTDLTHNDHACVTYGEPEELLDLTAAFVRDGLTSGLRVIWLQDSPPRQAMAQLSRRGVPTSRAAACGQLSAAQWEGPLDSGHAFTASRAIAWLAGEVQACRQDGYRGLWVAMDMNWALRPVTGVEQLPDFEEGIGATLAESATEGATAVLCQYDRERFDPVTLGVVTTIHNRSVAAATYHSDAVLRICRQYAPPGIRLAGEVDYHASESLSLALAEALRLDGDLTINLADLSFIDAACIRLILDTARSLAPGRAVTVRCRPAIAVRFEEFGAAAAGARLESLP